eukprot:8584143-Pyramimonas_sp.AAC.1
MRNEIPAALMRLLSAAQACGKLSLANDVTASGRMIQASALPIDSTALRYSGFGTLFGNIVMIIRGSGLSSDLNRS